MTHRSSPDSPRAPRGVTPDRRRTGPRLRAGTAIGAATILTVLVGLDATASPVPPPSHGQPVAGAAVLDRQDSPSDTPPSPIGETVPVSPDGVLAAANLDVKASKNIKQVIQPALQAAVPLLAPAAVAPIAEQRRASAAFEAAAGKVSAPITPPGPDRPEPVMPDFTGVARGSALGELQARFHEFQHNGWVVSGAVRPTGIERTEVIRVAGIPTHRFSTCIDSSAVEIRDTSGAVVLAAAAPGTRTATNIYDIQQHGGKWVVVAHSFPDVAAC